MLAVLALSAAARAAPVCRSVKLVERPGLSGAFLDAARALRTELGALPPEDCIDVTLILEAAGARGRLVAVSRDGDQAEREVDDPASLAAIARGLIASALPEKIAPTVQDDPMRESAADRPPAEDRSSDARASKAPRDKPVQLVFGLGTGARLGAPTRVIMGEVEARADVIVRGWIAGLAARFAPVGFLAAPHVPAYAYTEAALALELGRRHRVGLAALDTTIAPSFVFMSESANVSHDDLGGTDYDFRVRASTRLLFPVAGAWRPSITLDGEIAPFSVGHPGRIDPVDPILPPLPSWSLGLRLGAAGDLL